MNTPLRHSGMARVLKGSHSFTCTPRIHQLMEWTILALSFPAKAGTHLPAPEGWKAELAWVAGYIPRVVSGTGSWTQTWSPAKHYSTDASYRQDENHANRPAYILANDAATEQHGVSSTSLLFTSLPALFPFSAPFSETQMSSSAFLLFYL